LTPPKTIAPSRPLPTAKAETQSGAGWRYQRLNGSAGGGASPVNVTAEEFAGRHKANAAIKTAKMKCLTVCTIDLKLILKPYRRLTAKASGDAPGGRMRVHLSFWAASPNRNPHLKKWDAATRFGCFCLRKEWGLFRKKSCVFNLQFMFTAPDKQGN
jgi:hypothetical protein